MDKAKLVFDLTKLNQIQREKLYEAERLLKEVGVSFFCSTDFDDMRRDGPKAMTREWYLDHELIGPVKLSKIKADE
jgi:hypothetical protein